MVMQFHWQGSPEPRVKSGKAIIKVGDLELVTDLPNIATYQTLCKLIRKATEEGYKTALDDAKCALNKL